MWLPSWLLAWLSIWPPGYTHSGLTEDTENHTVWKSFREGTAGSISLQLIAARVSFLQELFGCTGCMAWLANELPEL